MIEEVPAVDEEKYDRVKFATFSMGCFWGPDSLFGAVPGVISTRVGYAGGAKEDPTYHSLGGHTETVQVRYDPGEVSFKGLIDLFWENHDPTYSKSTQYKSIVFFHDKDQKMRAEDTKERRQKKISGDVATEIRPFSNFYLAEDYHQKYHLSKHKRLYSAYKRVYPDIEDFIDSTAVTRANGYVSGHGSLRSKEELKELGLGKEGRKMLYKKWNSAGGGASCGLK